jgi:hypothetical protein
MAALGMEWAAAFTAGVEVASMAVAVECALAAEVWFVAERGSVEGRMRRLRLEQARPVPNSVLLCDPEAARFPDPKTGVFDPAVIPRAGINGLEIPSPRPLQSPMDGGIRLAALREAAALRACNRKLGPRVTRQDSASSTVIAELGLLARSVAFQGRVAKSGKMLPPREMLFPGLNHFPHFTVR